MESWHHRHKSGLTAGDRAADTLRNGMGSWPFVISALLFLAVWMGSSGAGFDDSPWILLNLLLSCLAALQGAILLIAAKRQDQIAAALAQHDAEVNIEAERRIELLQIQIARLENEKHKEILEELRRLTGTSAGYAGIAAALYLARRYGGIDGDHHKAWVIDQMCRHLAGGDYPAFVAAAKEGEDGPESYEWSEGIPP